MWERPKVPDFTVLHLKPRYGLNRRRLVDVKNAKERELVIGHPDIFIGDLDKSRAYVTDHVILYYEV